MIAPLIQPEIKELIEKREFSILKEVFSEWAPADLAELISDLPEDEEVIIFRLLPKQLQSQTFEYLDFEVQSHLLGNLAKKQIADILNEMSPDDRTALFEELPADILRQMLSLMSREERITAMSLLGYPENSIGRLMTTDYIAIKENMTIAQVLHYIRKYGKDSETLNMIYVIDDEGKLIDDIKMRQVLLAQPTRRIKTLMDHKFVSLNALDDQEAAVQVFKKYDYYALPVLDNDGILLGIVTIDDVLDVEEEEVTEDIHKMAAVEVLEESYIDEPLLRLTKKRANWLIFLFLGEMLTASAMSYFEHEIAKAVVLALFIPLIISSGGNSGSQASTLVIRAMAIGEIKLKDWWRVLTREVRTGFLLGSILGIIGFIRIAVWQELFNIYGQHWFKVGLTVVFSILGVVMWGTTVGSMLPFILRKIGIDPATSSAPFVATLVDVSGLIIYFNIAYLILKGTLL
ncbi:MAG: magnesium transporter [Spirochaetota bacterium]